MPYTKTPTNDTYSQENVSLTREWTSRQGDIIGAKDEQFINCFAEIVKNKHLGDNRVFIYKRGGTKVWHTPPVSGQVRGSFYWKDKGLLVYCIEKNVYLKDIIGGTLTTCVDIFTTTTGDVGFCTFLYESGDVRLITTDGNLVSVLTSTGSVFTITDPDLPTPHIPTPVFLDGYIFLAKVDTGNIYHCENNDPTTWTGDFITTEIESDVVRYIAKLNNYIVAFGSSSIEYFYDAGNATESPLSRNATPIKNALYTAGYAKNGNDIYFVGTKDNDQLDVFKLSDFMIEPIGSPTISRYLNGADTTLANIKGSIVMTLGHTFYVLNAGNYSFVYDFETKYWSKWSWQQSTEFDVTNCVTVEGTKVNYSMFTLGTSPIFYKIDDSLYQDAGVNFTVSLVTEPADFGTLNRKTMPKLALIADRPNSVSYANVSWSDDDFKTFSTPRTVNLDQDLPSLTRCGHFRQRSFKVTYTDNFPFRIQNIQVNINKARN